MQTYSPLKVKIWGERACFTNAAYKVERVSYETMTPSAARNILQSIFWKPEFEWRIREIHVLKPIQYFALTRNEIKHPAIISTTMKWSQEGGGYFIDEHRTQRHILGLRDVSYVIYADIVLNPHADADVSKYRDQFRRAVSLGQCFSTPFLGLREFDAAYGDPDENDQPLDIDMDLGTMLFDLIYQEDRKGAKPSFFHAELKKGILTVPPILYGERD
jgi:CRISPR-associated protein Cas5d